MSDLSDLIAALPVPEHRPEFWAELEARLAEVDAEVPAPEREALQLIEPGIGDDPDASLPPRRRIGFAVVAAAALIIAAVITISVWGDSDNRPAIVDTPPSTPTTVPVPDEREEPDEPPAEAEEQATELADSDLCSSDSPSTATVDRSLMSASEFAAQGGLSGEVTVTLLSTETLPAEFVEGYAADGPRGEFLGVRYTVTNDSTQELRPDVHVSKWMSLQEPVLDETGAVAGGVSYDSYPPLSQSWAVHRGDEPSGTPIEPGSDLTTWVVYLVVDEAPQNAPGSEPTHLKWRYTGAANREADDDAHRERRVVCLGLPD